MLWYDRNVIVSGIISVLLPDEDNMSRRFKALDRVAIAAVVLTLLFSLVACEGTSFDMSALAKDRGFDEDRYTGEIHVKMTEAPGDRVYGSNGISIDVSNADQGYMTITYVETAKIMRVQVTEPGGRSYAYYLNGEGRPEVFPFSYGNGTYAVQLLEQVQGTSYALVYGTEIYVEMDDETVAFTYPNQQINYLPDYDSVYLSYQLTQKLTTEEERVETLFRYVATKITYDSGMAEQIQQGLIPLDYLPDPDKTLESKKGVCYDYSALLGTLLRAQGIPTRMIKGYVIYEGASTPVFHAWNEVWTGSEWVLLDATLYGTRRTEEDYEKLYQF